MMCLSQPDRQPLDLQGRRHWGGPGGPCPSSHFFVLQKKKGKQRKARKTFKAETIKRLSLRSKLYCLSHSRASRILLGVPWLLHLEIYFTGPDLRNYFKDNTQYVCHSKLKIVKEIIWLVILENVF